jgi:hypothetical protein
MENEAVPNCECCADFPRRRRPLITRKPAENFVCRRTGANGNLRWVTLIGAGVRRRRDRKVIAEHRSELVAANCAVANL